MTEHKHGLGDPNRHKFDPSKIPVSGSSFAQTNPEGAAPPPGVHAGMPLGTELQPGFSTPPPGGPPPAVGEGQMPLPVGTVVTPASLSKFERDQLERVGWKEGDAIPGNLPELLAQTAQTHNEATEVSKLPPPGDPSKFPPLKMPVEQNIEELAPEDKARIAAALDEANAIVANREVPFQPAGEGVGAAAAGVVHKNIDVGPRVVDDRQDENYSSGEPKHEHPAGSSMTGSQTPGPKNCPHCGWDLAMTDSVDPEPGDKQSFLQAILGGLPWQRAYPILNDQVTVTVRQLAPEELDACYAQVYSERDRGIVTNVTDFWELINRYRTCLQLVDYRSADDLHTFPTSLEAWGGPAVPPNPTVLPQVIEDLRRTVIKTESIQRIVNHMVARFNRLAAKLEARVESPDFWEVTESHT